VVPAPHPAVRRPAQNLPATLAAVRLNEFLFDLSNQNFKRGTGKT
jgi:hypothetical protein